MLLALHEVGDHELNLLEGPLVLAQQRVPNRNLALEASGLPHLHQDVVQEVGVGRDVVRMNLGEREDELVPVALDVISLQMDCVDSSTVRVFAIGLRLAKVLPDHDESLPAAKVEAALQELLFLGRNARVQVCSTARGDEDVLEQEHIGPHEALAADAHVVEPLVEVGRGPDDGIGGSLAQPPAHQVRIFGDRTDLSHDLHQEALQLGSVGARREVPDGFHALLKLLLGGLRDRQGNQFVTN